MNPHAAAMSVSAIGALVVLLGVLAVGLLRVLLVWADGGYDRPAEPDNPDGVDRTKCRRCGGELTLEQEKCKLCGTRVDERRSPHEDWDWDWL